MCTPKRSPARASWLTSFPGSTAPPATSLTTRSVAESDQEIGESLRPPLRPISQAPRRSRSQSTPSSAIVPPKPPKTSPSPGRSPAELSARTIPPVLPLAPAPICSASNRLTRFSGAKRRSQAAAARGLDVLPSKTMMTDPPFGPGAVMISGTPSSFTSPTATRTPPRKAAS